MAILEEALDAFSGDVQFLNFANETTISAHPELFKDFYHLNGKGALQYTQLLVKNISQ